jgi:hypothetical protein
MLRTVSPKNGCFGVRGTVFLILAALAIQASAQFTIVVDPDTLKNRCETKNVKLVFIAKDSLWYVDFSEQNPTAKTVKNITGKPSTPVLSPDGKNVAFVTGVQDIPPSGSASAVSTAWICALTEQASPIQIASPGWSPRFDLSAAFPTVTYSTCGSGANCWNGCGKVLKYNTLTVQSSELWCCGSYFGGLSYNGQWLCTAENAPAYLLDRSNPLNKPVMVHRLHIQGGADGDTLMPVQTCNPSISSSRIFPDAMMYLDIGTPFFNTLHLGDWSFHGRIFISRSTNTIARFFDMPVNSPIQDPQGHLEVINKEWESPRWSNHPYFASAALKLERSWGENSIIRNESIYLINIHDSVYTRLITLADTSSVNSLSLDFPWLWVETPANFDSLEDKSWLNGSLDRNTPINYSAKINIGKNYSVHIKNGLVKSSYPMSMLEFFTLTGRRIGVVAVHGKTSVLIPGCLAKNGSFLIQCTFSDNKRTVIVNHAME